MKYISDEFKIFYQYQNLIWFKQYFTRKEMDEQHAYISPYNY